MTYDKSSTLSTRPVVAVFSHPLNSTHDFIAASYVKYLESGGARALRVPYNASTDEIEAIYEQTNGIFFPGGGCDLPQSARDLWSLKLKGEEEGDVYPAWGTCLGFEWINQLVSEDDSIIATHFNAENISLALDLTGEDSRMMPIGGVESADGTFTMDVGKLASTYDITMNMHAHGVSVSDFKNSDKLSSTFTLISTNKDLDGKVRRLPPTHLEKARSNAIFAGRISCPRSNPRTRTAPSTPHSGIPRRTPLSTARLATRTFPTSPLSTPPSL